MTEKEKVNPNVEKILSEIANLKTSLPEQFNQKVNELREEIKKIAPQTSLEKPEARKARKEQIEISAPATPATSSSHVGHILGCKDCNRELAEEIKKGLGECKGCGAIVKGTEPRCPFCGNTKARRII